MSEWVLELECGHTIVEIPSNRTTGDGFCTVHRAYSPIACRHEGWSVSCRGCSYGKKHGAAKLAAQRDASRHSRRCPTHTVHVVFGARTVEIRTQKITQLSLDDVPPF